jgi:hypothetical protein
MAKHRQGKANHPASLDSASLHKMADNLAGQQIIMAEARRLGYDRDPEVRDQVEARRDELMVRQLAVQEGGDEAVIDEETARRYYDAHLDRYRTGDGKVADFALVRRSVQRYLQQAAHEQAMDRFIAGLREQNRNRIEIHAELLGRANVTRPPEPPATPQTP